MSEVILLSITLIGGFAAGIYDLQTSNVPDKLCIAMILLGLLIHISTGVTTGNYSNLLYSLFFGGMFLIFSLAMYYTGQWGGGDGELLVTMGILLPNLSAVNTYFPFAISFFINSFFIGAVYSILYSIVMMFRFPRMYKKFVDGFKGQRTQMLLFSLFVISAFFFVTLKIFLFLISMTLVVLIVFQKFAKSVEEGFLIRIPVSKLKVDDTIGQDLPRLGIYKKLIKGLTKKQVRKIKRHKKYVIIKEGIRYGIVFPLSVLFTLFFGDLIFLFFGL